MGWEDVKHCMKLWCKAPLIPSLQVDTIGKECLKESKHLYYFKNIVPIPPLGMVDNLFTISTCSYKSSIMNQFINTKNGIKKLQIGTSKWVKLHVGKTHDDTLCGDLVVDGWKIDVVTDATNGKVFQNESFIGPELMGGKDEQM